MATNQKEKDMDTLDKLMSSQRNAVRHRDQLVRDLCSTQRNLDSQEEAIQGLMKNFIDTYGYDDNQVSA